MKTMVAFTMAALTTLVLATAADADVQDRRCHAARTCVLGRVAPGKFFDPGMPRGIGFMLGSTEIIERPHSGTAVVRADGSIYYSPKPGFTGRDSVRAQRAACNYSGTWHADPLHDECGHINRTFSIFVE
jgi:hypothetical protein